MKKSVLFAALLILTALSVHADQWEPITPPNAPEARHGHTMVELPDGRVMLFGGEDESGLLFNDMYAFDGAWWGVTPENDPPPARRDHQAWVADQQMYVHGGYGETNLLDDTWRYDIGTNTWHKVTIDGPTPGPRYGHRAVVMDNGDVLLTGGSSTADGSGATGMTETWVFDDDTNTFSQKEDSPTELVYHVGEYLWNMADFFTMAFMNSLDVMFTFHPDLNQWNSYGMSPPPYRKQASTSNISDCNIGQIILVMGGIGANGLPTKDVYEYDISAQTTNHLEPMPEPLYHGAAAQYDFKDSKGKFNQTILYFGGKDVTGTPVNTTMYFDPQAEQAADDTYSNPAVNFLLLEEDDE